MSPSDEEESEFLVREVTLPIWVIFVEVQSIQPLRPSDATELVSNGKTVMSTAYTVCRTNSVVQLIPGPFFKVQYQLQDTAGIRL